MLSNDFYGRKGFVWWTGVVEDVDDKTLTGALRVRIFGVHPKEKELVPVSALPWAQTVGSVKARPGDWVIGFFQDGEAAQIPMVLGVCNGIESHTNIAGKNYTPPPAGDGFYDPRTQAEVDAGPKPPPHIVDRIPGEPALQRRLEQGNLEGTGIQSTNSNLQYSCDVLGIIKIKKGAVALKTSQFMQAVRQAINALLNSLGLDPTGIISRIVSLLRQITSIIQEIRKFIEEIREIIKLVNQVLELISCIINVIRTLPATIARQIQSCLSNLLSEAAQGFASAFGAIVPTEVTSFFREATGLLNDVTVLKQDVTNTYRTGQAVLQDASTLPQDFAASSQQQVESLTQFSRTAIITTTEQFKTTTLEAMASPLPPTANNNQQQ